MACVPKDYLVIIFFGLSLTCCSCFDHRVKYKGSNEVFEGDPFEISCVLNFNDLKGWTVNSSIAVSEENDFGYILSERELDAFREELTLQVKSAQLFHDGEYRCNRYSRDYHYIRIIPASEAQDNGDSQKETVPQKSTNVYILEVNKSIEFNCFSAKDDNTPITWYKNSRRIVENSESNIVIAGLSLLIENAQEDDAGEYMCTVDTPFVTGFTDIGRIFSLNSPAKIIDFPEKESVIKGRSLNLHCKAQGFPSPAITWYIGNLMASQIKEKDLRISIYSADGGVTNSYLIFRDMTPSDRGLFTCRAENSIDSGMTKNYDEDSVFVEVRAVSSIDFSSAKYVQKGGKFILACEVTGLGVHLWYKDGKPIVPNSVNKFHLESDSPSYSHEKSNYFTIMRLLVDDADSIHTGEYKCNSDGLYSQRVVVVTENMIETNEDYPGMGKILIPGEPLVLQCNTSECPHCTVVWFKDGKQIHSIPNKLEIHEKNNSLTIEHSSYNDSGVYVCAIDRKQLDVALNATIVVQSKIKLEKFDASSVVVEGSPLEIFCNAKGAPMPFIKWFIGEQEIFDVDERVKILEHDGLKRGKLYIEEANFDDRNHYTCEAYNQLDSVNTTVFIRIKGRLAALWPFLGICAEVAILCSIIFVYERRKSMNQCDEPETDLPSDNKHRDQKRTGQDVRQRK